MSYEEVGLIMGKLIMFPCRDYYDVWDSEYEEYYGEEFECEVEGNDYCGNEVLVKESLVRGFVRKVLMFLLVRL